MEDNLDKNNEDNKDDWDNTDNDWQKNKFFK